MGFRWTESDSIDGRWQQTDLGQFFSGSISTPEHPTPKGLVIRVGDSGQASLCYDTQLYRVSAAWTGGFVQIHPARYGLITPQSPDGQILFSAPIAPGWSLDGQFTDKRPHRPYGPLPREEVHYQGFYRNGNRVVLKYLIGQSRVLESPWFEQVGEIPIMQRTLNVAPAATPIYMLVCGPEGCAAIHETTKLASLEFRKELGTVLRIEPHSRTLRMTIGVSSRHLVSDAALSGLVRNLAVADLASLTKPGPARWTEEIITRGTIAPNDSAYVVDTITLPFDNPYRALMFPGGHDFFSNGDIALCTVHGDVWRISGIDERLSRLIWKRFATGLFQPLGLRVVNDIVYVVGRDQITRLHDGNGDGEADYYENFNNEGQVTMNAHEYVTSLETDRAGNFYFLKGNSEGQTAHDGCLLKVSPDGSRLEVFATGFRNANGMSIGPDDTITVAPQEGEWTPASGVFQVRQGGFYGYVPSHHRSTRPTGFEPPTCWLSRRDDNSSGGQVWVNSDRWGPLSLQLVHLSYGQCRAYLVIRENVEGTWQGGTVPLPVTFESGAMRGRFNVRDQHLYISGLHGWVSNSVQDGCLQRVRYTGKPLAIPMACKTMNNGIAVTFSTALEEHVAQDVGNYQLQQWNYLWSAKYGSPEFKVSQPGLEGRDEIDIRSATLLDDRRTVFLEIEALQPCSILAMDFRLKTADGQAIEQTLNYTIHRVPSQRLEEARLRRPTDSSGIDRSSLRPGIVWTFEQGDHDNIRRDHFVARLAALFVPSSEAPTSKLDPGPFRATSEGCIRVPVNGEYAFTLEGHGNANLSIDGQQIIVNRELTTPAASTNLPRPMGWVRVELRKGFHRFQIGYASPASGDAAVRTVWKSRTGPDEPMSPEVLTHDAENVDVSHAEEFRRGRDLFQHLRCGRCHSTADWAGIRHHDRSEEGREAPDLSGLASRVTSSWLYEWLLDPQKRRATASMPRVLGDPESSAARQESADLVAFLLAGAPDRPTVQNSANAPQGLALYESLGCIGCHTMHADQAADKYHRMSLAYSGAKFQLGALADYLQAPQKHYPWNPMPDFRLSADESVALEAWIRSVGKLDLPSRNVTGGDVDHGRQLFRTRRCMNCHALNDQKAQSSVLPPLAAASADRGCLSGQFQSGNIPNFNYTQSDRQALMRFCTERSKRELPESTIERSQRLVSRLNCGACHARDGRASNLQQTLTDESELGLPAENLPNLTWVGERLQSDWSERFIAGALGDKPRTWMKARMPGFGPWAKMLTRGLAAEHGLAANDPEMLTVDARRIDIGYRLTFKNGGLDCRQCHSIGEQLTLGDTSSNVALGINFVQVRERLRYDFYRRFLLDPPRYETNTKMPKLAPDSTRTAATTFFDGDAEQQFDALWHYIQSLDVRGNHPIKKNSTESP